MNNEKTPSAALVPVAATSPARVKLQHINTTSHFRSCPPEGQDKAVWLERLKRALGTMSEDFVNATLIQIQHASRLPRGGISETSICSISKRTRSRL